MTRSTPSLVDRLSDRGVIDRWGFLSFALLGSAAIIVAKSMNAPPVAVAVCAALSMVAYAVVVQSSGTGRLRADQAGDNCYYLGLIYTLCSLAYAIFLFDPANTATTIVQGLDSKQRRYDIMETAILQARWNRNAALCAAGAALLQGVSAAIPVG
jgi:hypothetical protein